MNCLHGMNPAWCASCKDPQVSGSKRPSSHTHIVPFKLLVELCLDMDVRVFVCSSTPATQRELDSLGLEAKVHPKSYGGTDWMVRVPIKHVDILQEACPELRVHRSSANIGTISSKDLVLDILLRRKEQQHENNRA